MITLLTMSGPHVCPEQIVITVIIIIIMRSTFFPLFLVFGIDTNIIKALFRIPNVCLYSNCLRFDEEDWKV